MKNHHDLTLNQRVFIDWLGCQSGVVNLKDLRLAAFNIKTIESLHHSGLIAMGFDEAYNAYWMLSGDGLLAFAASPYAALGLLKDQPALELPL